MTEAETRVFQDTVERDAQTKYHDPRPTGPSYLAPSEGAALQSPAASTPEPQRLGRHGVLWGIALLVVVLLVATVVLTVQWTTSSSKPVTVTKPEVPPTTGIAPPMPPEVPQPPAANSGNLSDLKYPGADVTMEMTRGGGGSMLQLRTKDSFEKVVAWYKDKLKPSDPITVEDTAILKGSAATAVISRAEGETNIVVKKGIDR